MVFLSFIEQFYCFIISAIFSQMKTRSLFFSWKFQKNKNVLEKRTIFPKKKISD